MATALRLVTERSKVDRHRTEAEERREALEAVERLLGHDFAPHMLEAVDCFADCLRLHVRREA